MDRESVERLRYDRRLQRRSDWLGKDELEAHIESLPDSSEKMTRGFDDEEEASAAGPAPEAPAAQPAVESEPAPVPVAGDFSRPGVFSSGNDSN